MALNKAKILKSADKYVIQGKISHAIAEYQKLIKEDPTDLPLVNTLGDLYVRIGNIPEAVRCFTRLAESYDNGGFVVRAIAMYKKVGKIDPGQIQALSRLADLYFRQGLTSDARSHNLQVADYLCKKGDLENALIVYQKVVTIDPENAGVEGRVAEVYQKLGQKDNAIAALLAAGSKARRRGAFDEAAGYLEKAAQLDEHNVKVLLSHAEVLSELGRTEDSLKVISRIPLQDFKPEVLETSFKVHLKAGFLAEAEKVAHQLLELDPQHFRLALDLSRAFLAGGDPERSLTHVRSVLEVAIRSGDGTGVESLLKEVQQQFPEFVPAILELIKYYQLSNELHYVPALLEKAATIYVRRQEFAEAASLYRQLVQLEPNDQVHRDNLKQIQQKLGAEGEDASLPRLVPDMEVLADRFISEPTLKTIETKVNEPSTSDSAGQEEHIKSLIVEGDVFAGYGLPQKAIEQYLHVVEMIPHHIEVHEKLRDLYAKIGDLSKAGQHCLILARIFTTRNDSENANRNFTLAYQYDPNLAQDPSSEAEAMSAPRASSELKVGSSKDSGKRREEILQEVDFYLDLSFLSEAKSSIDQYLQVGSSDDPEFQMRYERYQSLLNDRTGESVDEKGKETVPVEHPRSVVEDVNLDQFESAANPPLQEVHPSGSAQPPSGFETTAIVDQPSGPAADLSNSFEDMMNDLDHHLAEPSLQPVASTASPIVPRTPPDSKGSPKPTGDFDDIFEEFKEGLDEEVENGDYETHYSLGIAFKEMGLLEEAIGEFQKALRVPIENLGGEELVRCCNMLGLCFVEKQLPEVAIKWFAKGLSSPGRSEETYQALRYDLGCAHELAGNLKLALDTFLDVYGININYRDVADRIESLKTRVNGQ